MTTTKARKPGMQIMTAGIATLALGAILLAMNLTTTFVKYVPNVGTVETQGTPSAGAIILIAAGLVLAGIGFAKRLRAGIENR